MFVLLLPGPFKRNSNGSSALALAALYGHAEITEYLLNEGFDVNSHDEGHRTPLHYAVLGNQIEISRLLTSKSAKVDAFGEILDQNKSTPLHLAVRLGYCEVCGKMNHHKICTTFFYRFWFVRVILKAAFEFYNSSFSFNNIWVSQQGTWLVDIALKVPFFRWFSYWSRKE